MNKKDVIKRIAELEICGKIVIEKKEIYIHGKKQDTKKIFKIKYNKDMESVKEILNELNLWQWAHINDDEYMIVLFV